MPMSQKRVFRVCWGTAGRWGLLVFALAAGLFAHQHFCIRSWDGAALSAAKLCEHCLWVAGGLGWLCLQARRGGGHGWHCPRGVAALGLAMGGKGLQHVAAA